jgi:AmmeMemoRadiSam system protein A
MEITNELKNELINLAKLSIEENLKNKTLTKINLSNKELEELRTGIFITLTLNKKLRGCIGFTEPVLNLKNSIIRTAKLAAFQDQRFSPLTIEEFKKIKIEITILTPKEEIHHKTPEDVLKQIELGKHGIIVEHLKRSGLLLPQVAIEHKMDKFQFLNSVCQKANLPTFTWQDKNVKLYKFEGIILKE